MKAILFALFVCLLMVGCGESSTPSTPSDPVDSSTTPEVLEDAIADAVDWSKLQDRGGVTYLPNTQEPFTGFAKRAYENEQVEILAEFKDGYVVRVKQWQENGTPRWDIGYTKGKVGKIEVSLENLWDSKDGKEDGLGTWWYENGQKRREANYKDGKRDGLYTTWDENGQKMEEKNWKDGKKDGLMTRWHENGQKRAELGYKDGKRDGLQIGWYENGQKAGEDNYKDGKLMSAEAWKPNGEKCPVTNFKDGNGVVAWYNEDGTEESRKTYKDGKPVLDYPPDNPNP